MVVGIRRRIARPHVADTCFFLNNKYISFSLQLLMETIHHGYWFRELKNKGSYMLIIIIT